MPVLIFAAAVLFGFTLSRSGAADYDFIRAMFLFEHIQLWGIIGAAVVLTAPGLVLLRRYGKTIDGKPLNIPRKPLHGGNFVGGALFGVGWAITGMCPGPVLVNIGEGKLYAIAAFAGVIVGTWLLGWAYPRMTTALHLPALKAEAASSK